MAVKGILLMALAAAALAQPSGHGAISGIVIDAGSGDPVRKAIVTLTWRGTPRSWATARTDDSGTFRFDGLPPGRYDLRARKTGIGTAVYGAANVRELGDLVTLGDGESRTGLKLRFFQSGSISGQVSDDQGDPVPGAVVRLLRPSRNFGARVLANQQTAIADDRGEYRITGIDPGEYYARAANSNGPALRMGDDPSRPLLLDVFYGDTRQSKQAAPIRIRGGERLTGIDFHLTSAMAAEATVHITGIPNSPPRPAAPGTCCGNDFVQIHVQPVGDADMQRNFAMTLPGGTLRLPALPPGQYRLQVSKPGGDQTYAAAQIFDLHSGENEIEMTLAPALSIKGQLRMEGPPAPRPARIQVVLAAAGIRGSNLSVHPGPDGRFTVSPVVPGTWEIDVTGMPRRSYLKSVRYGDKDVTFAPFEIDGADTALSIVVSTGTGKIEGEVDAGGGDASRAGMVLAPVGRLHEFARFYYSVAANEAGKFKMEGIAPGKYKIFAIERMAPASFRNPEAADQLSPYGEEIEVGEGQNVEAHPKLIPMERASEALP